MEKSLLEKKEKLFKAKEMTKWGGFADMMEQLKPKDKVLANKDLAFTYMLPKETKEYEDKRDEIGFFTN